MAAAGRPDLCPYGPDLPSGGALGHPLDPPRWRPAEASSARLGQDRHLCLGGRMLLYGTCSWSRWPVALFGAGQCWWLPSAGQGVPGPLRLRTGRLRWPASVWKSNAAAPDLPHWLVPPSPGQIWQLTGLQPASRGWSVLWWPGCGAHESSKGVVLVVVACVLGKSSAWFLAGWMMVTPWVPLYLLGGVVVEPHASTMALLDFGRKPRLRSL